MKKAFAFFDFDNTLIKGDSIFYLVLFFYKRYPLKSYRLLYSAWCFFKWKCHLGSFLSFKASLLYVLDDLTQEQLHQFYQQECVSRYYLHVVETLYQRKQEGCLIYLVSASPEAYLRETDLPVDVIIGTQTDGKSHRIISENCSKEEKVHRIMEDLNQKGLEIDYEHSYGYSDSESDLPMLRLVKHRFRIHRQNGEIDPF